MSNATVEQNKRPPFDPEMTEIADYVCNFSSITQEAYTTARYCLMDTLGCGILALRYPECSKLLGPVVPGINVPNGTRIPGTSYVLDPIQGAFNIGTMIRWLDFNDTWLAAEWGHPSDNLGGILAVADYLSQQRVAEGKKPLVMKDVLTAMIKAHEIQGVMALENSFNRVGLDHVVLVKLATAAIVTQLLGGKMDDIINVISQVWVDGQSLRTYRHSPNTGSRKSWAAGDATSRGVRLAMLTLKGEHGYPSALSAKGWGFYDVSFKGQAFKMQRPYGSYVMENVLFKISYPAEFHAQTAVECAVQLHSQIKNRLHDIDRIVLTTHESAIRIISKTGPLYNYADRDHCLQYMVAIGLLFGNLTADHYLDEVAIDARIDELRNKMEVIENSQFSKDYHDPDKRSIANAIQIHFKDGTSTHNITIEYPIGHRRRRNEGIPVLEKKFKDNLATHFSSDKVNELISLCSDQQQLEKLPVNEFMDKWIDVAS